MGEYRNIFLGYNVPSGPDFDPRTFTLGPRRVRYQLQSIPICSGSPVVCRNPGTLTVPAGRQFAGLTAIQYRYVANSTSEINPGDIEASIGTEFDVDYIPIFQFLAFYAGTLEIEPGATMILHGPIHTNSDLYLNSDASLTIEDLPPTYQTVHLSAAGRVFRGRLDRTDCRGTVTISELKDANNDGRLERRDMPCSGWQSPSQLSNWLGSITAQQPAVAVPNPSIMARGNGDFWEQADLRIVLDMDNPDGNGLYRVIVQNQDGSVDNVRTNVLQTFMNARPGRIFYNAVPTDPSNYTQRTAYSPAFPLSNPVYGCGGSDLGLYSACAASNRVANESLTGFPGVTARRGGFFNRRENEWVRMLNVNVHDLLAWNRAQSAGNQLFPPDDSTDGGVVIFLSVAGPGALGIPSPRYGVRVFGSSDLDFTEAPVPNNPPPGAPDPTGLTVVSDQALYVEGSYNAGRAGFPKQPAALMGDTVNVLSNNWWGTSGCKNDCQSRLPLADAARDAADTVVLAAFIGGIDRTIPPAGGVPGSYNGGLENYPRFHEDWGGRTFFYRGSFVSLGIPQHNRGAWCGTGDTCNIYNAPRREWDFDMNFLQAANLPPITPRFVSVQQILFTENFR
jgi:hypothetical protein